MSTTTNLVPPRRLGTLLRQARIASGLELDDLAAAGSLGVADLDDVEHGRRTLDRPMLDELIALYGVEHSGLVPERSQLVIDLDEGRISVSRTDVAVEEVSGPDAVLARYLALVYRLRELPVGSRLQLREIDLDVLSTALAIESGDVEERLHRLIDSESEVEDEQRRIRRQLLLPLVGVVVAATTVGTLILVADGEAPPPEPVSTVDDGSTRITDAVIVESPTVTTDLGTGGAVEQNPDLAS